MFNDNGDAVRRAAAMHIKASMNLFAAAMDTMGPEALQKLLEHFEKGARLAVRVMAPEAGVEGVSAALTLCHPDGGEVVWVSLGLHASTTPTDGNVH